MPQRLRLFSLILLCLWATGGFAQKATPPEYYVRGQMPDGKAMLEGTLTFRSDFYFPSEKAHMMSLKSGSKVQSGVMLRLDGVEGLFAAAFAVDGANLFLAHYPVSPEDGGLNEGYDVNIITGNLDFFAPSPQAVSNYTTYGDGFGIFAKEVISDNMNTFDLRFKIVESGGVVYNVEALVNGKVKYTGLAIEHWGPEMSGFVVAISDKPEGLLLQILAEDDLGFSGSQATANVAIPKDVAWTKVK